MLSSTSSIPNLFGIFIQSLMVEDGKSSTVKKFIFLYISIFFFVIIQICLIKYARIQGLEALISHFQFSSVMNKKDKNVRPVIIPKTELSHIEKLVQMQVKFLKKSVFFPVFLFSRKPKILKKETLKIDIWSTFRL